MAISTELMGPGFFVFFREEETGALGRVGQSARKKKKDILRDDEDIMDIVKAALPYLLSKYYK